MVEQEGVLELVVLLQLLVPMYEAVSSLAGWVLLPWSFHGLQLLPFLPSRRRPLWR